MIGPLTVAAQAFLMLLAGGSGGMAFYLMLDVWEAEEDALDKVLTGAAAIWLALIAKCFVIACRGLA